MIDLRSRRRWRQEARRKKKVAHGEVVVVRYTDDAAPGFQHRTEAERFLAALRERLGKFGLEPNLGEDAPD